MQQHPFQHGAFHYVPPRGSLVPSDRLENVAVGSPELSAVPDQEWDTNRNLDAAEHLCGPWIPDWKASPRGRICVFSRGDAHSLACDLVVEEIGKTAVVREFCGVTDLLLVSVHSLIIASRT